MGRSPTLPPDPFARFVPHGHFYSPLPGESDLQRRETGAGGVPDVEINAAGQRAMLLKLSRHYAEMPFQENPSPGLRYCFKQNSYGHADAIYLYSMLREFRPKRLIEIGSGWSSALTLDTSDKFLDSKLAVALIEPYPDLVKSLLKPHDLERIKLIPSLVQDVPLAVFDQLEANDILFIDSSHVCKAGSDVYHEFFRILPRLRPGVIIHVHDIFWPFEYPDDWLREGRAWNELYLVRAFLQHNPAYEILLFASYAGQQLRDVLNEKMPLCLRNTGGALWLRKLAP